MASRAPVDKPKSLSGSVGDSCEPVGLLKIPLSYVFRVMDGRGMEQLSGTGVTFPGLIEPALGIFCPASHGYRDQMRVGCHLAAFIMSFRRLM
jgi:hypothetical protein